MTDDARAEKQALCTRAAEQEAKRQAALQRGDWFTQHECERELRALWRRHSELEARERVA